MSDPFGIMTIRKGGNNGKEGKGSKVGGSNSRYSQ